jgi:heme-degrading monooxygenase HmoA
MLVSVTPRIRGVIRRTGIFHFLLLLFWAAGVMTASAQDLPAPQIQAAISNKEGKMEVVVIDSLIVPEQSKAEFLQRVHHSAEILRKLPGFVEGYIHEKQSGESELNIVTTAVWKDQRAFENARKVILAEYAKQGTDPGEIMKRLHVRSSGSLYSRTPY